MAKPLEEAPETLTWDLHWDRADARDHAQTSFEPRHEILGGLGIDFQGPSRTEDKKHQAALDVPWSSKKVDHHRNLELKSPK